MADLPIQRLGPTLPPVTGTLPRAADTAPTLSPTPQTPIATTSPAVQTMLGAIAQAVADLPPDTALAVFLAAVERVTAEVEARVAQNAAKRGDLPPDPARLATGMAQVSERDLAAAAALIAGRLVPDPRDPPAPVTADDTLALPPEPMMRDRLFLLDPTFADPALPGRSFYCRDCVTIDGLLALFPQAAAGLDVIRVPYPRPRAAVVQAAGIANQNLPLLVFAQGADPTLADGRHGESWFAADLKTILRALHRRHGFPEAHP
ncbi:DUF3088 domain-containing protein [Sphingomonas sp. Leaf25]|uniref:DUF3088 domain-containing protein n=1 Tax=Sphingomonas sp. Leaf25 TaxID=1735692 RepID=UPI000A76911F|nr:DUF3088 family protein [Sphingomonas sp. Leaf25]